MSKKCSTSLQRYISQKLIGQPSSAVELMVALILRRRQGKKSKYKMTLKAFNASQDTKALASLKLIQLNQKVGESHGVVVLTQDGIDLDIDTQVPA